MTLPKSSSQPALALVPTVDTAETVPFATLADPRPAEPIPTTTGLDFEAPPLNPAPVPDLADFQPDPWAFLAFADPIEDPGMLAFQVAQLTVGMGELLGIVADLQQRLDEHERTK